MSSWLLGATVQWSFFCYTHWTYMMIEHTMMRIMRVLASYNISPFSPSACRWRCCWSPCLCPPHREERPNFCSAPSSHSPGGWRLSGCPPTSQCWCRSATVRWDILNVTASSHLTGYTQGRRCFCVPLLSLTWSLPLRLSRYSQTPAYTPTAWICMSKWCIRCLFIPVRCTAGLWNITAACPLWHTPHMGIESTSCWEKVRRQAVACTDFLKGRGERRAL